jgi:molybdate/tungstate transport system substrate-binding protein
MSFRATEDRRMKFSAALLAASVALVPGSSGTVSVAYAASLVAAMEGPVARALSERTGIRFAGEAKGSRALASLIRAGLRAPDVFISADPKLLDGLASSYTIFGSARMVIAYSTKSPHAQLFAAAARGKLPLLDALTAAGVRVGRTDPRLDPKGARTVRSVARLGSFERLPKLAQILLARAGEYPEEDLTVRVETGALDAGFFYSTETARPGLRTIELPGGANLSGEITYALAVMPRAPHPLAARTFSNFILSGEGRHMLEAAGVRYFAHPQIVKGKPPA